MAPTNWRIPADLADTLESLVPGIYPSVSRAIDDLVRRGLGDMRASKDIYTYTLIELFHTACLDGVLLTDPGSVNTLWISSPAQPGLPFHELFDLVGLMWSPAPGVKTPTKASVVDLELSGPHSGKDGSNFLFPERIMGAPWPSAGGKEQPIDPMLLSSMTPDANPGSGFAPLEAPLLKDRSRREPRQWIPVHDKLIASIDYEPDNGFPAGRLFAVVRRTRPQDARI